MDPAHPWILPTRRTSETTAHLVPPPGKQLWYIQDRAKDMIKAGKPIAGQPMNDAAKNSGIAYKQD